jgi:hypothetical protein
MLAGRRYKSGRFEHPLPKRGELRLIGLMFHPLLLVLTRGSLVFPKVLVRRLLDEQCWSSKHPK